MKTFTVLTTPLFDRLLAKLVQQHPELPDIFESAIATIDGKPFQGYEADIVKYMNGADLILWLKLESTKPVEISIKPVGGSAPVRRAVPRRQTGETAAGHWDSRDRGPGIS